MHIHIWMRLYVCVEQSQIELYLSSPLKQNLESNERKVTFVCETMAVIMHDKIYF